MRRLFLHIGMSLDGYVNDEAGLPVLPQSTDDEFQRYIDEILESIDGMVYGRVAFERLAAYWPNAGPEVSPIQAREMHELPKYVLSRTLTETEWHNSHLLGDDPAAAIAKLKHQNGRDLALFAGAGAATSAFSLGMVDELRIIVNPVLVGGGTRLFDGQYSEGELRLTHTRRFASGVLLLRYELASR